jgi:hypothetical protein
MRKIVLIVVIALIFLLNMKSSLAVDIPQDISKCTPAAFIDPNDPSVMNLVNEIAKYPKTAEYCYQNAYEAYRWVGNDHNIKPITENIPQQTPSETISKKSGDCKAQSVLIASFALAMGCPHDNVRVDYGIRTLIGGHQWAVIFTHKDNLPDKWYLFDTGSVPGVIGADPLPYDKITGVQEWQGCYVAIPCGNNVCEYNENCQNCPQDCGPCTVPNPPSNECTPNSMEGRTCGSGPCQGTQTRTCLNGKWSEFSECSMNGQNCGTISQNCDSFCSENKLCNYPVSSVQCDGICIDGVCKISTGCECYQPTCSLVNGACGYTEPKIPNSESNNIEPSSSTEQPSEPQLSPSEQTQSLITSYVMIFANSVTNIANQIFSFFKQVFNIKII